MRRSWKEALAALLQKGKPYSTPNLGSPDQSSLSDLLIGPPNLFEDLLEASCLRRFTVK